MDIVRVKGKAIRTAYEGMGLERAQFAEAAGIPAKTVTNITSRDDVVISRPRAVRIANVLGCTVDSLIADSETEAAA